MPASAAKDATSNQYYDWIHRQAQEPLVPLWQAQLAKAKKAKKPVVVMFTADWCAPCQVIKHFLHESPSFQKAAAKGTVLFIDVDEWRGPAHRLIPGVNPSKLPTLVRVDYAGAQVRTAYGTSLGLLSEKSASDNLGRLIAGKELVTPFYESQPKVKQQLIVEQARQTRERAKVANAIEVKVVQKKDGNPLTTYVLDITIHNPDSRRRWFAMAQLGETLVEEPQIDSWAGVAFKEHVRAHYMQYYGTPTVSLFPVASNSFIQLKNWTVQTMPTTRTLEIWELQRVTVGGKPMQFQKKVPYDLIIQKAAETRMMGSGEAAIELKMTPEKKHRITL